LNWKHFELEALLQIELEALWTGSTLAIELEALFSRVIVM
jgi:hypothetical protein